MRNLARALASLASKNGTTPGLGACLLAVLAAHAPLLVQAQGTLPPTASAASQVTADGPAWKDLTRAQQNALKPLERDWWRIDGPRKRKWLEIAGRYPTMSPDERERVQDRMSEWVRLSPQERNAARLNYRAAKDLPSEERRERWETYQSLSEDRRRELADQAAQPKGRTSKLADRYATKGDKKAPGLQAKSNIVPNPSFAAPPSPVSLATVQARPGATTTPITRNPTPPWHQQPGLPKIAATPEFVDSNTLLPVVGPQAAGTTRARPNDRPRQQ